MKKHHLKSLIIYGMEYYYERLAKKSSGKLKLDRKEVSLYTTETLKESLDKAISEFSQGEVIIGLPYSVDEVDFSQ